MSEDPSKTGTLFVTPEGEEFFKALSRINITSLPRFVPPPDRSVQFPDPCWVSGDDLKESDFKGEKDGFIAAVISCPNGHTGTIDRVAPTGWVDQGVKCHSCDFFVPALKLEGWKPSFRLRFGMAKAFAAEKIQLAMEEDHALAHARMVRDAVLDMPWWVFIGFTGFVVVANTFILAWRGLKSLGRVLIGRPE